MYEFVDDGPDRAVDPTGANRCIFETDAGAHHGLIVDNWTIRNGKWVKIGTIQYDFSVQVSPWGLIGAAFFGGSGDLARTPNAPAPGPIIIRIPSSPQEDLGAIGTLDAQAVNPPKYNWWLCNCNDWTTENAFDGMKATSIPRGAEWTVYNKTHPIGGPHGWSGERGSHGDVMTGGARE
jgi:hypothetical protein